MNKNFNTVGKSVRKIDSLSLAKGNAKFTDDFPLKDALHISILYSPHAHAEILSIDTTDALAIPGVVRIFHHENVPAVLHTTAGQGFPEPSAYDSRMFDSKMRFVGDRVAAVAAETKEAAEAAINAIRVEYRELEPLFDPEKAMEPGAPRLHGDDAKMPIPVKYDSSRNLAAEVEIKFGDLEKGFQEADFVLEDTFYTQYAAHCAIEPHTSAAYLDERDRLVIITATQVPFHARRIVSRVLDIPIRDIRVIKPRIGGGFGGKQEVFLEQLVGLTTWSTGRSCKIVLTRPEVFVSSRTRHPMRVTLKTGVKADGEITALEMDALMNNGAYGSHALTVLSNGGSKVLPLFNKIENIRFIGHTVYTNLPVGGAYRGYGATQTYFALNQHLDMIARKTKQDLVSFIKKWHIKEGETSPVFQALGEGKEGVAQIIKSCKLDECLDKGATAIGWYEKRNKRLKNGPDKVRGVGLSVSMQGSGIPKIDMGAASMKMNEDGSFNLYIGATDLGTGSDTILAQIAAETLDVPVENIIVLSSDTDLTPFDVGAYASSTTYISGAAVKKCAAKIREQVLGVAAKILNTDAGGLTVRESLVTDTKTGKSVSYSDICTYAMYSNDQFQIQASASNIAAESPPPFIAQFAEVEVDTRTGKIRVLKFVSAVDCGQPINPALAEGQVEGAVVNGLSYALTEDYLFDSKGRMTNPRFWDFKIFTAKDLPEMETILVDSYEETGPYGAKSVGEIAINGPIPAIANAVFDATGVRLYETPFTPERVWKRLRKEKYPGS
ncbi:MAG: molybdopterin-dependent oxidoreductase [Acidobacteria bacterium]|nr:molybdopterin-dependent oxidoreductase [Acidobacteriota bacterium]